MSVADMARALATHCEGKWHALRRDNKSGDWLMTFTIATTDFPAVVRDASPGQRFMLALVPIDDDEMPVSGGEAGVCQPVTPEDAPVSLPGAAPTKRRWSELSRAQRAGMRCSDPEFQRWLAGTYGYLWVTCANDGVAPEDRAAEFARNWCGDLRRHFDRNKEAGEKWDALEARFMQATGRMAVDR